MSFWSLSQSRFDFFVKHIFWGGNCVWCRKFCLKKKHVKLLFCNCFSMKNILGDIKIHILLWHFFLIKESFLDEQFFGVFFLFSFREKIFGRTSFRWNIFMVKKVMVKQFFFVEKSFWWKKVFVGGNKVFGVKFLLLKEFFINGFLWFVFNLFLVKTKLSGHYCHCCHYCHYCQFCNYCP